MENSELPEQIINLGKLFVQELKLDPGSDTFSKWMAHYIAEKMTLLEQLSPGSEKKEVEKECFETILKLWERRSALPSGKRPFESFEPILKLIQEIDPENRKSYYVKMNLSHASLPLIDGDISKLTSMEEWLNSAKEIDEVARMLIIYSLKKASAIAKNDRIQEFINNAIDSSDNQDVITVRLLIDGCENLSDAETRKNLNIQRNQEKIQQLEKFVKTIQLYIDEFKKEIEESKV
ncbi:MAG: hypothetical protein QM763_14670 [Agriterribacter sp.]